MTETERRRVDAIAASEETRLAIAAELERRQALGATELHLAVDAGQRTVARSSWTARCWCHP